MDFKKWLPICYPLTFWLVFKLVAFIFGFTPFPNISQLSLFGSTYPFITSLAFGMWVGIASAKDFKLFGAIRNAITIAFIVGFAEVLFTLILVNTSPSFVSYVVSVYPAQTSVDIPFLNLVIATWAGGIFVIIPASAASYLLVKRDKKK